MANNGYVCFYTGLRWETYAPALYEAKKAAIAHWKVPKSKQHMVSVMLAEKLGQDVIHVAVD